MDLNQLWFILIAVLYIGYFFLEGFDYGVGILLPLGALQALWPDAPLPALVTGTVAGLLYAYLVRFSAVALQSLEAGYARLPTSLDDSARMLGASRARLLGVVHLPLLRRSVLAAARATVCFSRSSCIAASSLRGTVTSSRIVVGETRARAENALRRATTFLTYNLAHRDLSGLDLRGASQEDHFRIGCTTGQNKDLISGHGGRESRTLRVKPFVAGEGDESISGRGGQDAHALLHMPEHPECPGGQAGMDAIVHPDALAPDGDDRFLGLDGRVAGVAPAKDQDERNAARRGHGLDQAPGAEDGVVVVRREKGHGLAPPPVRKDQAEASAAVMERILSSAAGGQPAVFSFRCSRRPGPRSGARS